MKRWILLVAGLCVISTGAHAGRWTEPGWYQVADGLIGLYIHGGPFEDEDTCRRTLPKGSDSSWFTCDFLYERPDFDD